MIIVFKRVFRWILISVVIQLMVLAYFNFVYIPNIGKSVGNSASTVTPGANSITSLASIQKATKVILPVGASQTKLSYDNLYVGYIIDGELKIYDINTGAVMKDLKQVNRKVTFFKWLYDRNLVLYSVASVNYAGQIQMFSYDMDTGVERSYHEEFMPSDSEIVDIELSPLTNVFYTKVKTSDTTSRIYKYNIMNVFSFIMRTDIDTRIAETKYNDFLVYQDNTDVIQIWDGMKNTTRRLEFDLKVVLLEVDSEDNIYAGELNVDGKVKKIWYGKNDGNAVTTWKNISLVNATLPENIHITPSGKIYVVDTKKGSVLSVSDGVKMSFKGKFIEAFDERIAINNNGNLDLLILKK